MTGPTLDDWLGPPTPLVPVPADSSVSPWAFAAAVRIVGTDAGPAGFTVEDVRAFYEQHGATLPLNPGALLGSMTANGELRPVADEPARIRSSRRRRLRRFVLVDDPPVSGGGI